MKEDLKKIKTVRIFYFLLILIFLLSIISLRAADFKISHQHSDYENEFISKSRFSGDIEADVYRMAIDAKRKATPKIDKYELMLNGGFGLEGYKSSIYLDAEISSLNESIEFGTNQTINSADTEFSFNWDSRIKSAYTSHKVRVGADLYPEEDWSPFLFLTYKTNPQYLRQGLGIKNTFLRNKGIFPGKNSLSWAFILQDGSMLSSWRHKIEFKGDIIHLKRTQFIINGESLVDSSVKITPEIEEDFDVALVSKYKKDENEETYSEGFELEYKKICGLKYMHKYKAVHGTELSLWLAATNKINIEYSIDVYDDDKTQTMGFEVKL